MTFQAKIFISIFIVALVFAASSCKKKEGCCDPQAKNYDASAEKDDGSCEYVQGCTDSKAINFSSDAVKDDGTCQYAADQFIGTWNVEDSIQDVFVPHVFHHRQYVLEIERSALDPDSIKITNLANVSSEVSVLAGVLGNQFTISQNWGTAPAGHIHDHFFLFTRSTGTVTLDTLEFTFQYAEKVGDIINGKGRAVRTF